MENTNVSEEKIMTESEFFEAQKEALKKNIRIWTGVLIYLLVVGLVLCLIVYGVAMLTMFVINLLSFLKTKKLLERIESGEASVKEVYEYYEALGSRTVKIFAVNIFLAGGFGVIGTINDMKLAQAGIEEGGKILGDDYKNERIANDPNAQRKFCVFCKRNKAEAVFIYRLTDGVICADCLSKYSSMLPKRVEDPALLKSSDTAHYLPSEKAVGKLSSKDLEERYEYLNKNREEYSNFTPTKVICDGCLELDENNSLFRIVSASDFDSTRAGVSSGLVHPYDAVKGVAYELIYEYETPYDDTSGGWKYTNQNSIILAIDNPYLKEETFTLNKIPTNFFASSKKPQIEYAEQTVNELQEIFNKPVLASRKVRR
jgi:hypothetical protein